MDDAWYNENDAYPAQWLDNLIGKNLITGGHIDERSIKDVRPADLRGFQWCHFFAGIAGWDYAFQTAGWPADRPVWSGSCPCQPFSQAGERRGFDDPRHLWPDWRKIIEACRPGCIFGEQTGSKDGKIWMRLVATDLEALGYTVRWHILPVGAVGAPHLRQRIWFTAFFLGDTATPRVGRVWQESGFVSDESRAAGESCSPSVVADAERKRRRGRYNGDTDGLFRPLQTERSSNAGAVSDPECNRSQAQLFAMGNKHLGCRETGAVANAESPRLEGSEQESGSSAQGESGGIGTVLSGFWSGAVWIECSDGKARSFEPGSYPLAYGVHNRTPQLRAYGNSISSQIAAEWVALVMEAMGMEPAI